MSRQALQYKPYPEGSPMIHRRIGILTAGLWLSLSMLLLTPGSALAGTVKIGVLKFGTVSWELDVIKQHGLDKAAGIDLSIIELANNQATAVALQAGEVDVIVTDWLWVTRQRAEGARFTFVPYSTSVGSLVVPGDSPIKSLADLRGKRLGIAGGPVDKSWLVIRAMAAQRDGLDLDASVDKIFGAPPLLNEQIQLGEMDALINNWNFVAQLEAKGYRRVVGAEEAARALGVQSAVPLLGYVFNEDWAATHKADILGLIAASRQAKKILAESDADWQRLRPMMKTPDDATYEALRNGYRAGIPRSWGETERSDAAKLFTIMAKLGGRELVGKATELQPGTFWADITY
jgi:NitT/TauT family transport system substrate-binding protein